MERWIGDPQVCWRWIRRSDERLLVLTNDTGSAGRGRKPFIAANVQKRRQQTISHPMMLNDLGRLICLGFGLSALTDGRTERREGRGRALVCGRGSDAGARSADGRRESGARHRDRGGSRHGCSAAVFIGFEMHGKTIHWAVGLRDLLPVKQRAAMRMDIRSVLSNRDEHRCWCRLRLRSKGCSP